MTFALICAIIVGLACIAAVFHSQDGFGGNNALFEAAETTQIVFILFALAFIIVIPMIIRYLSKSSKQLKRIAIEFENEKQAAEQKSQEEAEKPAEEPAPDEPRFFMLNELDAEMKIHHPPAYDCKITMAELCERFRSFAAGKLKLYYSIDDIRRFISNLASSHILIMQGMSGTGKTSLAYAFGEFIKNPSAIVPIQPMWKERSDLLGYYNEFTRRFSETLLLQKMYEANYKEDMFVVILDEMNIARVEYYFAEFLSLLEIPRPDRRYIDVVSDVWENDPSLLRNGQLRLPPNIWFIGTANNDDSTFAISDKVYDRAMIMNLDTKADVFEPESAQDLHISASYFDSLAKKAQKDFRLTGRNRRRLRRLDEYMIEKFKITFGNRITKQIESYIPAYIACGGDEIAALDDIISKKVFRKLDTQNPIYVRNNVEALSSFLDELFGYDKMPLCKAYLSKFERSA